MLGSSAAAARGAEKKLRWFLLTLDHEPMAACARPAVKRALEAGTGGAGSTALTSATRAFPGHAGISQRRALPAEPSSVPPVAGGATIPSQNTVWAEWPTARRSCFGSTEWFRKCSVRFRGSLGEKNALKSWRSFGFSKFHPA